MATGSRRTGKQYNLQLDEDIEEEDHGFALSEVDYDAEHEVDEDIFRSAKSNAKRKKLLSK